MVRNVVTPASTSVRVLVSFSDNLNKRSIIVRISNANCSDALPPLENQKGKHQFVPRSREVRVF